MAGRHDPRDRRNAAVRAAHPGAAGPNARPTAAVLPGHPTGARARPGAAVGPGRGPGVTQLPDHDAVAARTDHLVAVLAAEGGGEGALGVGAAAAVGFPMTQLPLNFTPFSITSLPV